MHEYLDLVQIEFIPYDLLLAFERAVAERGSLGRDLVCGI